MNKAILFISMVLLGFLSLFAFGFVMSYGVDVLKADHLDEEVYRQIAVSLISLLIGIASAAGIYGLFLLAETMDIARLTKTAGFHSSIKYSKKDWKNRFSLPIPSSFLRKFDVKPVLWHRGTGLIATGVLHLIVPVLAWQAAIPLVLIGLLNIILPIRLMFILNGLLLSCIGIWNAFGAGGIWQYLGVAQCAWGLEEMGIFYKKRPKFSMPALSEHLANISDSKEKAEFLLGVFIQHRKFGIRKGILDKLADMGDQAACVAPNLKVFLGYFSPVLTVWIHRTLSLIEGSVSDHSKAIATILREDASLDEDSAKLNRAILYSLTRMDEHGLHALLSVASDSKCRAEARAIAIEALERQIYKTQDWDLRVNVVSAWIDAMDDKRASMCVCIRARKALTNIAGKDLGKHKDKWTLWLQTNKTPLIKKWEL